MLEGAERGANPVWEWSLGIIYKWLFINLTTWYLSLPSLFSFSFPKACIDENLDMVKFLVEYGANVNQQDNEGWTPLHAVASCGYLNIAEWVSFQETWKLEVNSYLTFFSEGRGRMSEWLILSLMALGNSFLKLCTQSQVPKQTVTTVAETYACLFCIGKPYKFVLTMPRNIVESLIWNTRFLNFL